MAPDVLPHPQAGRINQGCDERAARALLGRNAKTFNELSRIRGSAFRLPAPGLDEESPEAPYCYICDAVAFSG
jgi:hypothetical protein